MAAPRTAYFSMEIGLEASVPTYSGGLGVLAGDTLKAAADLGVPMVGVTLLYRRGYFHQRIDAHGRQSEEPATWRPEEHMTERPERISLQLEGRMVLVRAWQRDITGVAGDRVPVLFLDTDLDQNDPADRGLTGQLYGGDQRYRLKQEAVLGVGGVRMLRAMRLGTVEVFHMNEGHAALLAGELLREELAVRQRDAVDAAAVESVRRRCVFTTHTPVPAGHDRFPLALAREVLGSHPALERSGLFDRDGDLHMTWAAINLSRVSNAVSQRHAEVSRRMFPGHQFESVTNGVHVNTWVGHAMAGVFDAHCDGWRRDASRLRGAMAASDAELWEAHASQKKELLEMVRRTTGVTLDAEAFTIGFARRATGYKRAELVLSDPDRLRRLAERFGPIQLVFGGKAHPHDGMGKDIIARVHGALRGLGEGVRGVWVPEYDMDAARTLVGGVDLWLNTPEPPLEASGTSGMKAAINGVPQASTLDGWWLEGWTEGVTGWGIGSTGDGSGESRARADAASLHEKLESAILPLYAEDRPGWCRVMRQAIALNGSYFHTHRMLREYVTRAYFG